MGVRGLNKFIGMNPHLCEDYELHDTKLVIDGNSLIYYLYFESGLDCVYGGDYNRFFGAVREFFVALQTCNVTPLVLFDGGDDVSDKKFKTRVHRSRQRLSLAQQCARHGGVSSQELLPILAQFVFMDVLNELNITHATCDFEADANIASVANHFECPVLSRDSDFYIYDVRRGYIQLDTLSDEVNTKTTKDSSYSYLKCSIYYVDRFLEHFPNIEKSMLPFFSTLMGNDFSEGSMFNSFFAKIRLPQPKSKKLKFSKQHSKMLGLLTWLSSHDMDDVMSSVLFSVKNDKREEMRRVIKLAMSSYNQSDTELIYNLENKCDMDPCSSDLVSYWGDPLPQWFMKEFRATKLSPFLYNAVGRHRVFLLAQIEDTGLPSSYDCSLTIRKVIYGILLSFRCKTEMANPKCNEMYIEEYDRRCRDLKKQVVEACYEVKNFGNVPSLKDLRDISMKERLKLLLTVLRADEHVKSLPDSFKLYFAVSCFWVKTATPKVSDDNFNALIVCFVYLHALESCKTHTKENDKTAMAEKLCEGMEDLIKSVPQQETEKAEERLSKLFRKPQLNHAKPLDIKILHSLCQFQACLLHAIYLNQLLGYPLQCLKLSHCLNGIFFYNMSKELEHRPAPDVYIAESIGRGSALEKMFVDIKNKVLTNDLSSYLVTKERTVSKKKAAKSLKSKTAKGNKFSSLQEDTLS